MRHVLWCWVDGGHGGEAEKKRDRILILRKQRLVGIQVDEMEEGDRERKL